MMYSCSDCRIIVSEGVETSCEDVRRADARQRLGFSERVVVHRDGPYCPECGSSEDFHSCDEFDAAMCVGEHGYEDRTKPPMNLVARWKEMGDE